MKDLLIIAIGYRGEDGNFIYEYKHQVKWNDLEVSDNLYEANEVHLVYNDDGTIKEKKYIKRTTKELIYKELRDLLVGLYYIKKDKKDLDYDDKIKLRELNNLKKHYLKYIDKQFLIISLSAKEIVKKERELKTNSYSNKEFDKDLVSNTYEQILLHIDSQINKIEEKKKKYKIAQLKKNTFRKISKLLLQDYTYQKNVFKDKELVLKKEKKKNNGELLILNNNFRSKNLQNHTQKAVTFLSINGIFVDINHK